MFDHGTMELIERHLIKTSANKMLVILMNMFIVRPLRLCVMSKRLPNEIKVVTKTYLFSYF